MKKITLLTLAIFFICCSWRTNAQDENCGTELNLTETQKQRVIETMQTDFVEFHNNRSSQLVPLVVPVQIHIVQTSAGTGGIAEATVLTEIEDQVIPKYASIEMTFATIGPTNFINSDAYYSLSGYTEGQAMSLANSVPNVLNIYFVGDANGACGWARFTTSLPEDYIVIDNNCASNTSTLAHEIGHYFDLFHTHETAFGSELVARTNCSFAGDLFCDTPADPRLSGLVSSYPNCTYTGVGTDGNGQAYVPDTSQIMSYAPKQCRVNFTPEAESKVLFTAANDRSYIFNGPIAIATPITVALDATGNVTITGESVDNGSIGNGLTFNVSPSSFTCTDLGMNTVTLTVTDTFGTTASTTTTVTIVDPEPIAIVCQNPTVYLDETGSATITSADLDGGSTSGICGFATSTMTVSGSVTTSLEVSFAAGNGQAGNMFDVVAINPITIDSFDVNSQQAAGVLIDLEVYYKTGTWVGSEITAGDWALVGTVSDVASAGPGVGTPLNLNLGINVGAGETVAFYVTGSDGSFVNYTNGSSVGSVWAADTNLQILEGAGKTYPFGATYQPRSFNGNIVYDVAGQVPFSGTFDCADIGPNVITFNISDFGGNSYSCEATVTIKDANPVAIAQDVTLVLDAMGNTVLTPADLDNGSANFCGSTPFLALETVGFDGQVDADSPTDEVIPGDPPFPFEGSAFRVPATGIYTFGMTSAMDSGRVILVIWNDTPILNSGSLFDRPEGYALAGWSNDGTLVNGTDSIFFEADKTYYMSIFDNAGGFGTFSLSVDTPIRSTSAKTTYNCTDAGGFPKTLYTFDGANNADDATATVTINRSLTTTINPMVFLQGPMDNPTTPGLMNDDLRANNLIPIASPYSDGIMTSAPVFSVTGADAIVDWVWLELRSSGDKDVVIEGRSALLQRDGNIVDTDGSSAITFNSPEDSYYLLIQHRNHLSILSATALALCGTTSVNLSSDPLDVFGGSNAVADLGSGIYALYGGDFNGDGNILNTDITGVLPLSGTSGYSNSDANMDGQTLNTDIQLIIQPNSGRGIQY